MIIERKLKEKNEWKREWIKKTNKKIKLPIKAIQTIIKKKIQKCEIFLYNSSLRAEATCEFY